MKMWLETTNEKIEPPHVRKMPGRPKKKRRKEIGETKGYGKASKRGIAMSCSICKSKNHNKRCCPNKPQGTQEGVAGSQASTSNSGKERGRGRGRGGSEGRGTSNIRGRGRGRGRGVSGGNEVCAGEERSVGSIRGRGMGKILQLSQASNESGKSAYKRPRLVGHGVFVSQSGYTCAEQGRPVSRVISSGATSGATSLKSSAIVTGDIGYQPSKGLKWKDKKAITTRQLQEKSALLRYQKEAQQRAATNTGV